jgi:hypothetical protein
MLEHAAPLIKNYCSRDVLEQHGIYLRSLIVRADQMLDEMCELSDILDALNIKLQAIGIRR